jgi:hypothetical protein
MQKAVQTKVQRSQAEVLQRRVQAGSGTVSASSVQGMRQTHSQAQSALLL